MMRSEGEETIDFRKGDPDKESRKETSFEKGESGGYTGNLMNSTTPRIRD